MSQGPPSLQGAWEAPPPHPLSGQQSAAAPAAPAYTSPAKPARLEDRPFGVATSVMAAGAEQPTLRLRSDRPFQTASEAQWRKREQAEFQVGIWNVVGFACMKQSPVGLTMPRYTWAQPRGLRRSWWAVQRQPQSIHGCPALKVSPLSCCTLPQEALRQQVEEKARLRAEEQQRCGRVGCLSGVEWSYLARALLLAQWAAPATFLPINLNKCSHPAPACGLRPPSRRKAEEAEEEARLAREQERLRQQFAAEQARQRAKQAEKQVKFWCVALLRCMLLHLVLHPPLMPRLRCHQVHRGMIACTSAT